MRRRTRGMTWFLMVLASLAVVAGCSGPRAGIRKVDRPTEKELRAGWKEYRTYCLESRGREAAFGNAVLFQLKGDNIIQKADSWREVASEEAASGCASYLSHSSPVMQLLGANDEVFGYVIYNFKDGISAAIIDPRSIRLFYHENPKGGGP